MGVKRNFRELLAALENEEPVRLARSVPAADPLHGFVVGIADDWVLLHRLHDVHSTGGRLSGLTP